MFEDVEIKLKKKNQILFSRESACLQELIKLIRNQDHRILILWAFDCIQVPLKIFETQYPNDLRPRKAFELSKKWAYGEIKMPIAKRAILDCHQVCKEDNDKYIIALCHAIAQGLSTVHVETHAIGLPIYELTAIVIKNRDHYQQLINDKVLYYIDRLHFYQDNVDIEHYQWANFLLKEEVNKEDLLRNK